MQRPVINYGEGGGGGGAWGESGGGGGATKLENHRSEGMETFCAPFSSVQYGSNFKLLC